MGAIPLASPDNSENSPQDFTNRVQYVMKGDNPKFGEYKIYKMVQKPYDYLIMKRYATIVGDTTLQTKKLLYERLPKIGQVVGCECINLRTVKGPCGQNEELEIYCKYYFFSLDEAIKMKYAKNNSFQIEEVLYVLKSMVAVYQAYRENSSLDSKMFRCENIFLTPEGFIKVYPFINDWKQEKNEDGTDNLFSFASDSELEVKLSKRNTTYSLHQLQPSNDILDIGVVLLSMLFLSKEEDYLNTQGTIKFDVIRYILQSPNEADNKLLNMYKPLLRGIFIEKWGSQKFQQEIAKLQAISLIKSTNRIKIINPQNQQTQTPDEKAGSEQKRNSRLRLISKNQLIPGKINCIGSKRLIGSENSISIQ